MIFGYKKIPKSSCYQNLNIIAKFAEKNIIPLINDINNNNDKSVIKFKEIMNIKTPVSVFFYKHHFMEKFDQLLQSIPVVSTQNNFLL